MRITGRSRPRVPTIGGVTTTSTSPVADMAGHLKRIAEDGYTILPDAIEPDLVDEIDEALLKLERDLGIVPADNLFEGAAHRRGSTTCSSTARPSRRSRCIPTCCRSSKESWTRGS